MGFSRGAEVFDPVAWLLVDADLDDALLDKVLFVLADRLTDADWDTLDESIEEFAGYPVVQHALRKADRDLRLQAMHGDQDGDLFYRSIQSLWQLDMAGHAPTIRPATIEGFNALIDIWAVRAGIDARRSELVAAYKLG